MDCETPGMRIRSGGRGRGLATGQGKGPMGVPFSNICETPGAKIRSGGAGRGLARGGGRGPIRRGGLGNVVDLFGKEGRRYRDATRKAFVPWR